jgi:hypothetical protein
MDDNLARLNALIDEQTEKAAKIVNKYGRPKYIAALIEIVISSVAIVGIQIVSMGFDFSKLSSWQFWVKTASLTACIFLLFRAVINARFDKTASRKNVLEAKENYNSLNKDKGLDLKEFLNEFNLQTKINAYVGKINKRINRLERKKIKTYSAKKKMSLTAKINVLKEEIKPERIKEIIDIIHVKYYMVWYDDFENVERVGGNGTYNTRGYQSYNKAFNKASFNKIWAYILCSAIMAVSVWTFGDTTTVTIIANILSSSIMIVTRVLTAYIQADRIYDSTITASYVCKTDILKQYYNWKNARVEVELKTKQEEQIKELNSEKPIEIGRGKIEVA